MEVAKKPKAKRNMAPPPPPLAVDDATELLRKLFIEQRKQALGLPQLD